MWRSKKKENHIQDSHVLRRYSTVMRGVKEIPYENIKLGFRLAATKRRGLFQSEPAWDKAQHAYVDWRRQRQATCRKETESRKRKEQEKVVRPAKDGENDEDDPRAQGLRKRSLKRARELTHASKSNDGEEEDSDDRSIASELTDSSENNDGEEEDSDDRSIASEPKDASENNDGAQEDSDDMSIASELKDASENNDGASSGSNGTISDDPLFPSMTDAEADKSRQDQDLAEFMKNDPQMAPGEDCVYIGWRSDGTRTILARWVDGEVYRTDESDREDDG